MYHSYVMMITSSSFVDYVVQRIVDYVPSATCCFSTSAFNSHIAETAFEHFQFAMFLFIVLRNLPLTRLLTDKEICPRLNVAIALFRGVMLFLCILLYLLSIHSLSHVFEFYGHVKRTKEGIILNFFYFKIL